MKSRFLISFSIVFTLTACTNFPAQTSQANRVLAVESFLADIAQNVAGSVFTVDPLIPSGADPHSFEITPRDLVRIENSDLLLINGGGLEVWLDPILANSNLAVKIIVCSEGIVFRDANDDPDHQDHGHEHDPHFWMNPLMVIQYVENIEQAFSDLDPSHAEVFQENARAYTQRLLDLDQWIENEVSAIPAANRILVTNHENMGYFADRYQFEVVGTILVSATSLSMPSASDLVKLQSTIIATNAPAIFLHTGENTQIADQLASDLGISVVTDLYTHSLSDLSGPAPDYISMMKHNTALICDALR